MREPSEKKPSSPSLNLLLLAKAKGLEAIISVARSKADEEENDGYRTSQRGFWTLKIPTESIQAQWRSWVIRVREGQKFRA